MADVTKEECLETRMKSMAEMNDRIDGVEGRVARLEEQVSGDMGIIQTLQRMSVALQELRDALNKQSWILPIATAAITLLVVGVLGKVL